MLRIYLHTCVYHRSAFVYVGYIYTFQRRNVAINDHICAMNIWGDCINIYLCTALGSK